jgi:hypothetical protein
MTAAAATYSYWPTSSDSTSSAPTSFWPTTSASTDGPAKPGTGVWKDGKDASFHDLLDIINPLQHLPVVATVYRWLTGDEPGNLARVAGDALYGGPIGAVTGLFSAISRDGDGEDMGERMMTWAFGPGHAKTPTDHPATAVADGNDAAAAAKKAAVTAAPLPEMASTPAPAAATAAASVGAPASGTPGAVSASAAPSAGSTRSVASVAALYRSTDPAGKPAAATATSARAPMPLARPGAAPQTAAAAATGLDPAQQLSAQNAMFQRQMAAGRSAAPPTTQQLVNNPVPLQLTGQTMPGARPRGVPAAPVVATASASPVPSTRPPAGQAQAAAAQTVMAPAEQAAKAAPAPAAPADLAVGTPAEISQKMMSALDKYMRMQQQQGRATIAAGAQVDVSP